MLYLFTEEDKRVKDKELSVFWVLIYLYIEQNKSTIFNEIDLCFYWHWNPSVLFQEMVVNAVVAEMIKRRKYTKVEFARNHPGGSLGKLLCDKDGKPLWTLIPFIKFEVYKWLVLNI